MYRSDNTTGVYRLKIANIDKLYIFNMQLFMFLYMGIFFDTTLRGLLHCYIVTFAFFHFTFNFLKCGLSVKDIQSDS